MPLKLEEYNNLCVLAIDGDFTASDAETVRKTIEQTIDKKQIVDFVVDCEKTSFIDSEGLETLLWMKRRCEDLFGQVKLAGMDENCRKILEITRLDNRFECHATLSGALKTMR